MFCHLKEDEQILLIAHKNQKVINGPGFFILPPFIKKIKRKALALRKGEYAKVMNTQSCEVHLEKGPKYLFLKAYEEFIHSYRVMSLAKMEYCRILNEKTGHIKIEKGPKTFALNPGDKRIGKIEKAIVVGNGKAVLVWNLRELISLFETHIDRWISYNAKNVTLYDHLVSESTL